MTATFALKRRYSGSHKSVVHLGRQKQKGHTQWFGHKCCYAIR